MLEIRNSESRYKCQITYFKTNYFQLLLGTQRLYHTMGLGKDHLWVWRPGDQDRSALVRRSGQGWEERSAMHSVRWLFNIFGRRSGSPSVAILLHLWWSSWSSGYGSQSRWSFGSHLLLLERRKEVSHGGAFPKWWWALRGRAFLWLWAFI